MPNFWCLEVTSQPIIWIALMGRGESSPVGQWSGNLTRSDFDHSNLFQSQKQHSVNTEHRLKWKLAYSLCTKSMKLKLKWYRNNDQVKFNWVMTWKLLFSGRQIFLGWGVSKFLASGGTASSPIRERPATILEICCMFSLRAVWLLYYS